MEAARGNWRRLWDPPFLPYKAFYFLLLASKACLIPFLPPYYRDKGLSPQQVGVLSALMPLTMIPSQPLWGALADATGKHRLIHASTTLLGSIGRALISVTPARMVYLVTVVFLSNWLAAPALAMGDSATNTKIERLGRESSEYGKQRLWGAISWGWVFAPGMGAFITYANGNAKDYGPFVAHAVFALATAIASTRLEHTSYRSSRKGLAATKGMAADVAAVLLRAEVIVHYLVFLVMACSMGAVDGFLFVYIQDLGGTRLVMGLALTFTCLSEVYIFAVSGALRARAGKYGSLHLVLWCYFLRLGYYAIVAFFPGHGWPILPIQLLHGITFALFWALGIGMSASIAPEGMQTTMQGIFSGLNNFGSFVGQVGGGALYEHLGPQWMWAVFALASAGTSALLCLYQLAAKPSQGAEREGPRRVARLKRSKSDAESDRADMDGAGEADSLLERGRSDELARGETVPLRALQREGFA